MFDYVEIRDGKDNEGSSLGTYCGTDQFHRKFSQVIGTCGFDSIQTMRLVYHALDSRLLLRLYPVS